MNWQAIGAIGEILGAVAVVVTLAYLAVQVKHAKAAAADANRLSRAGGVQAMLLAQATQDDLRHSLGKVFGTGAHREDFAERFGVSVEDAHRFEFYAAYWFWLHWGQYASITTEEDVDELRHLIQAFYSLAPLRYMWETSYAARPILDRAFVSFVDDTLAEVDRVEVGNPGKAGDLEGQGTRD